MEDKVKTKINFDVRINGLKPEEFKRKLEEYYETLKKAKTLAEELASVNFCAKIKEFNYSDLSSIRVETDEENPIVIARLTPEEDEAIKGYRIVYTPKY